MEASDEMVDAEGAPYTSGYFSQKFLKWSPLGTYLATVDSTGASVWGGATFFNPLMRYHHPQVRLIDFSPGEKYLVIYDRQYRDVLQIFDLKTGELKMRFWGREHDFVSGGTGGVSEVSWPVIRWSGGNDDSYFSTIEKNIVSIYETKTFALMDYKPLRVENIFDYSWSPVDPILALLISAHDTSSQPTRVSLVKIPSKEELIHRNLINLGHCKMYWQSEGDYLAVMFNRISGTKTCKYTSFVFFQIRKLGIPITEFKIQNKDENIIAFSWEPKGHRFAVIHGKRKNPDISLYSMRSVHDSGQVSKLVTLKGMRANTLFWSPVGRFILLAGSRHLRGQLNFYDSDALETLATNKFVAKDIEWSPSGRCLATFGTLSKEMGKGVKIWSFCGQLLYQIPRRGFVKFLWRPRPPSFLCMQTKEEIVEELKKKDNSQDAFMLMYGQHLGPTKIPEGWDRWFEEFMRLGKVMLKNAKLSGAEPGKELEGKRRLIAKL